MINRNLENKIKQLSDFIKLWGDFQALYNRASKQQSFTEQEETNFLELKSILARKYQALMDALKIKTTAEDRTFEVISQVMNLQSINKFSPLQFDKLNSDWHNSYIALNKVLGSLENQRTELGKVSAFGQLFKKLFSNPIVVLVLIIIVISALSYLVKNFF
ncbi:MAG: hypothetical protein KKB82_04015 [Candidatus Omnitrophica bacterium]|nr:hypothetical protein [Candidatus Omnitrophota bacterium]MBU1925071.1 hypothetical protein [Candidatus Omnitrophota bacterium]